MILVDTNILLRMAQPSHTMHADAVTAVSVLRFRDEALCVVPQILYEYWVAATRPVDANGLGMSSAGADADLERIIQRFRFARDERAIFQPWRLPVTQHQVIGKNDHDARLVAATERHGIQEILTFNGDDFKRYAGITVLSPAALTAP